jgi:hypothetical protein
VGLYAWRSPPGELPFADHHVLLYLAFVLSKGDDISSLIPSRAIINSSQCLVRPSLRITRSQHVHALVEHRYTVTFSHFSRYRRTDRHLRRTRCYASLIASFARSLAVPFQSCVKAFDQRFSAKRLGQETRRFCVQRSRARAFNREGRDENERHAVSLSKQAGLQFNTAHCRHLNIRYHTRRGIQLGRSQELFGRRECMDDVPNRPHEIVDRGANGSIVVND